MTTLVSGRVVDDATGEGVPDVLVEALGDWTLTSRRLALTQTGNAGGFALAVKGPVDTPSHPAIVRLRVQDVAGRALAGDRDVTVLGAQQTVGADPRAQGRPRGPRRHASHGQGALRQRR